MEEKTAIYYTAILEENIKAHGKELETTVAFRKRTA